MIIEMIWIIALYETLEVFFVDFILIYFNTLSLKKFLIFLSFSSSTNHLTISFIEEEWYPYTLVVLKTFKF